MNFFRSLVGEPNQRSRASSSLTEETSSFTPSYSLLRTRESEDECTYEEFDEVTMEDIGKAERAQTQERMESERDASQCDATNEEIAAHATEEDENSVCREYEQGTPLDRETWAGFSDQDGRIINELKLRKCVFRGGIDESIRPEVWSFLFGLYPLSSTYREREVISADYHVRYRALKRRWQTMLHLVTSSEAVPSLPDYMSDEANFEEISDKTEESGNQRASTSCSIDSIDSSERDDSVVAHIDVDSGEKFEQFSFAELQAQVYATRQPVDFKNLHKAIKLIDKDVPRTDRDQPLFRSRQNLKVLRDVLITYATFHPEVSYVQGMNDIAGRFLYVFKSEVETYWSLDRYIDKIKGDFLQETMLAKMALIGKLLEEMDPELCSFLQSVDLGHLVFCHRWLILCFKREFKYNESLQLFEILSSCHLELTSLEAEQARAETRIEQVLKEEGQRNEKADQVEIHQEYTFDLFVCVAILKEHREDLMACADQNLVFQYISSFAMKLDVDTVLEKSQELFFLYCKKSVMDCFQQDSCVDGSSTKT